MERDTKIHKFSNTNKAKFNKVLDRKVMKHTKNNEPVSLDKRAYNIQGKNQNGKYEKDYLIFMSKLMHVIKILENQSKSFRTKKIQNKSLVNQHENMNNN